MKVINWDLIEEAGQGVDRLPAGGYVARITAVEDVSGSEYLWCEYDIAEGEHAGHYAGVRDMPYVHRFSRSYKEAAQRFFKSFLTALEQSNRGRFSVAQWQAAGCDEQAFVGLEIGIVVQDEQYTNTKGEDKTRQNVEGIYAAQDIRNGDYTVPAPKDTRVKVPAAPAAPAWAPANEAVPF